MRGSGKGQRDRVNFSARRPHLLTCVRALAGAKVFAAAVAKNHHKLREHAFGLRGLWFGGPTLVTTP